MYTIFCGKPLWRHIKMAFMKYVMNMWIHSK